MLSVFLSFVEQEQLITDANQPTLLAVSGGVDSVVLCHLFKQAHLPFAIAHCNFKLRGVCSEQDADFVHDLAKVYEVPFYTMQFETKTFAATHKVSIQMAARTLRYNFFRQLCQENALSKIATAHHLDDSIETVLLNLVRGTGVVGLQGIRPLFQEMIRPLLFARKKNIIMYAKQEGLSWREDHSNQSDCYRRNLIRNKVMPILESINPNVVETMRTTCMKLHDVAAVFQGEIQKVGRDILVFDQGIGYLDMEKIAHLPGRNTLLFEILRPYGFSFQQVLSAQGAQPLSKHGMMSGKMIHSVDQTLYIDRKRWMLIKKEAISSFPQFGVEIFENTTSYVSDCNQKFYYRVYNKCGYTLPNTPAIAALDYDCLLFPLTLRPWQPGDAFYPLGMKGLKKVSDFLIDLKIPLLIKKRVMVVTSNGKIIWVVGYRIDDRFKLTPKTKSVFEITWDPIEIKAF